MDRRRRFIRDAAAVLLVTGLFAGTFIWQSDDTWPLAQMRMFPGGGESAVAITLIQGEHPDGRITNMNPFVFHLKRAEIEGQMDRIRANPAMLGDLIERYNRTVRGDDRLVRIVLTRRETVRVNGKPKDTFEEIVRWPV